MYLWKALKNFFNEDRSRFLLFTTGQQRLPASVYISTGQVRVRIRYLKDEFKSFFLIYWEDLKTSSMKTGVDFYYLSRVDGDCLPQCISPQVG